LYRKKVFFSLWLAVSLFSLGVTIGQMGPTFLDLQIITNTNVEEASAFFTGTSIGYLTGSIISGAIYNKVNKPLLEFTTLLLLGVFTTATPHCSNYPLMIILRTAVGTCCGCVDTSNIAEHMRIWGNEGQALMQLLHFALALGGVISPLYSEPFLAEKSLENDTTTAILNETLSLNYTNMSENTLPQTTNVHWAFLITGIWTLLSSIPFLVFWIQGAINKKKNESKKENKKITQRDLPKPVLILVLLTLCFMYVLYCCVEDTFASFLMTFLVKEYDYVTKSKGAHVTALYWASFATSRFLMIFISKFITAVHLLFICCTLMLISFLGFFSSAIFAVSNPAVIDGLIFFSVMAGLSMSAVFPSGFSWTEAELLKVTGRVSSCILVSASIGTMVNPLMLGYLMTEFSNIWFCYLLLGETIALCCVFLFLWSLNRFILNNRY
ncbi:unnamed protein product, partial [Lymnaea stagnalis]